MAGKTTDRKKAKETKPAVPNVAEAALAAFTLPESLSCSEVSFPVLIERRTTASWADIVKESEKFHQQIEEYTEAKAPPLKPPFLKTECDYIQNEVFVYLIPALIETLNKAKLWEALKIQKCFFNGIDHIAQLLWNNNPRHPERSQYQLHIFNMPWVREELKIRPRPYYPKSWLWPEDYAATLIQKTVRQFFVQKQEDVAEMREFWKKIEYESHVPEMDINPFLSKLFATSHAQKHKDHEGGGGK